MSGRQPVPVERSIARFRDLGTRTMGAVLLGLGWLGAGEARRLWLAGADRIDTLASVIAAAAALALAATGAWLVVSGAPGRVIPARHDPWERWTPRARRRRRLAGLLTGAVSGVLISTGLIVSGEASRSWADHRGSAASLVLSGAAAALIASGAALALRRSAPR